MGARIAFWLVLSLGYWVFVSLLAAGTMLSACEPPLAGCARLGPGHILLGGLALFLALGIGIWLVGRRRGGR